MCFKGFRAIGWHRLRQEESEHIMLYCDLAYGAAIRRTPPRMSILLRDVPRCEKKKTHQPTCSRSSLHGKQLYKNGAAHHWNRKLFLVREWACCPVSAGLSLWDEYDSVSAMFNTLTHPGKLKTQEINSCGLNNSLFLHVFLHHSHFRPMLGPRMLFPRTFLASTLE